MEIKNDFTNQINDNNKNDINKDNANINDLFQSETKKNLLKIIDFYSL